MPLRQSYRRVNGCPSTVAVPVGARWHGPGQPLLCTMVKCLIKIKTKVSVHLWLINHCCREVRVRVLVLGPRLLARALGALPLVPVLPRLSRDAPPARMLGNAALFERVGALGQRLPWVSLGVPLTAAPGGRGMCECWTRTVQGKWAGVCLASWTLCCWYHKAALLSGLDPAFPRFCGFLCQFHGRNQWQEGLGFGGPSTTAIAVRNRGNPPPRGTKLLPAPGVPTPSGTQGVCEGTFPGALRHSSRHCCQGENMFMPPLCLSPELLLALGAAGTRV